MYIRFRKTTCHPAKDRLEVFKELYEQIHRDPPAGEFQANKQYQLIRVILVSSHRVQGRPRQKHIGTLLNVKLAQEHRKGLTLDKAKIDLAKKRMEEMKIPQLKQEQLIERITSYFADIFDSPVN